MPSDDVIPPANPDILLDAVRVRVEFGALVAVNNLSLQLAPGTLLGLIGPNGAGKTTLLRALAGMQPMAAGLVRVMGEKATRANARLWAVVGFTGDNPPAYEGLSVRDYLRFIARSYHLSPADADERIALWLDKVWLTEKADQKVKALSRGMRQRLGIARTLLPNPHVVLLDEPAAGLDPAGRVQFRQLLCSLRDMGKALIVSSHILADLNEYCTHIGIMAHGQMVQYGTVAEVAAAGDGQRCRYTLSLARAVPEIADLLARVEQIGQVSLDREQASFEYRSDKESAAGLLAMLIREGVPVAGFTAHRPDLEQAYLRAGIRQVD